jgi:hypothetical protein
MRLIDEFSRWLREQGFGPNEVNVTVQKPWWVDQGVEWKANIVMGIEEFLILTAEFVIARVFGNLSGVHFVAKLREIYAFHVETKTVLIMAAYSGSRIEPPMLEELLDLMIRQASEARDFMALRKAVLCE